MALFGKKKNTKEVKKEAAIPVATPASVSPSATTPRARASSHALLAPRITEKGAYLAEAGCYVFNVARGANKREIALAIQATFGVTPRMVRVLRVVRKSRITRGTNRTGMTAGGRKAYVYLKKGDKIEIS